MYVKSNMSVEVQYRTGNHVITLKPHAVNYVDEKIVTFSQLASLYGHRISKAEAPVEVKVEEVLEENKEVKDFLEGKTEELPEGTEEITVEEAKELEEEKIDEAIAPVEVAEEKQEETPVEVAEEKQEETPAPKSAKAKSSKKSK